MSNRRISELNQLLLGDIDPSDYLLILDSNEPETKKISVEDISDYIISAADGVTSASIQALSASFVLVSSSVSVIESHTSSFATVSQSNGKLSNSLTSSFYPLTAFGLPTLSSSGIIYPQFLPNFLASFNTRAGDVIPLFGDYSASLISFISSSKVPQINVQDAIDHVSANRVDLSGDTMTGPLILSEEPVTGLQASTKNYVDLSVKKAGDTMTGTLDAYGIIVSTDLLYAVSGTSSVGIGTITPTESAKLHVAGRIRVDEIQFSGDETIQTTAGAGGSGAVSSFNSRTGSVTSETSDYLGFYVDDFNGRSGSVSAAEGDYDGFYVSTTGSSTILQGGIIFEQSNINFEYNVASPHDTSSIGIQKDTLDGRLTNVGIYANATSSLNGLIQDGDYAIIIESSLSGSEDREYDLGDDGIVIGPYSSGSKGLRISNNGIISPGRFESYGYTEMGGQITIGGNVTIGGTVNGDGLFVWSGSTILHGNASSSNMDVAEDIQARKHIYSNGNIYMASKDGVDVDYGSIFSSELYVLPRSENGSGQFILSVPSTISAPALFAAPFTASAPISVVSVEFPDTSIQTTAYVSPYSTSSAYTIDTPITASHGLGRQPYVLQAKLRCIVADSPFDVGDEVPILMGSSSIYSTTSSIYFLPKAPLLRNKDGLTDAIITDSNWVAVLTAI